MKHTRRVSRAAFALFALSLGLRGQQASGTGADEGLPAASEALQSEGRVLTLHAGTHMVALDVVVTDKKGHTVPGLTQDDFHIFEDGRPQTAKFFEEHAPVDPALVAKQKADLAARLPPNTFTNYEPFTGTPPLLLLLNELLPLPGYDYDPLYQRMLDIVQKAPPETPFVVYEFDSQLRMAQSLTTNRELVLSTVKKLWDKVHFSMNDNPSPALVLERRKVLTSAMQQLVAAFAPTGSRTTIFAFTGGLRCSLSASPTCANEPPSDPSKLKEYLCSVMDILEQGRMSIYRYYPDGQIAYGFACDRAKMTTLQEVFETNSHYYTFYYSPTNDDWNGAYRRLKVDLANKSLHATYRTGYYGRPENTAAGHFAAATDVPSLLASAVRDLKATAAPDGSTVPGSESGTEGDKAPTLAPNPAPVVFSVQVIPAAAPGTGPQVTPPAPGSRESEADRLQGYRDYTLRFVVPVTALRIARELKPGQTPAYTARVQTAAVSYVRSSPADAKTSQVAASFDGPNDPRIAKGEITASLTLQVPEKGKRLLHIIVRDAYSGQTGMLDIPVEKIVLPRP
jgi:VWFA-related protein